MAYCLGPFFFFGYRKWNSKLVDYQACGYCSPFCVRFQIETQKLLAHLVEAEINERLVNIAICVWVLILL